MVLVGTELIFFIGSLILFPFPFSPSFHLKVSGWLRVAKLPAEVEPKRVFQCINYNSPA